MKKNNPHVPIMIREGTGVLPRIYARYGELDLRPYWSRYVGGSGPVVITDGCTDLGQEKSRSLEGMFPHVFKWECRSKANGLGQQVSAISRSRRRLRGSSRPRALRAAPSGGIGCIYCHCHNRRYSKSIHVKAAGAASGVSVV